MPTEAAKRPAKKSMSTRTATANKAAAKPAVKKPAKRAPAKKTTPAKRTTPKTPPTTEKRLPPEHLGSSGRKLWGDIADSYELRPDEYRILEDAAREADLIELLAEAQREQPVMITGSMGQSVLNPLIAEVRQHRSTLSQLLVKLKLPDDLERSGSGESSPAPASDDRATKARAAAQARWSRRGA